MYSTLRIIRTLFRAPESLALYGIPYLMRDMPNGRPQSPRDLYCRRLGDGSMEIVGPKSDWIWLGTPGWFGHYNEKQIGEIKAFLKIHHDSVPSNPYEWSVLPPIELVEELCGLPASLAPKPASKGQRYVAKCGACEAVTSALTGTLDRQEILRNLPGPGVVYRHPRTGELVLRCRSCGKPRTARLVKGTYKKSVPCNAKCTEAKGFSCECSCAGKNHGASYQQ